MLDTPSSPGPSNMDDPARWDALIALRPKMITIAQSKLPNRNDAEDIVQEAILQIQRQPYLDLDTVEGYFAVTVTNLCIDQHRLRHRDRRRDLRLVSLTDASDDSVDTELCDTDQARWIRRALLPNLPQRQREVMELKIAGRELTEIAESLKITYGAAYAAFSKAQDSILAIVKGTLAGVLAFITRSRWKAAVAGAFATAAVAVYLLLAPLATNQSRGTLMQHLPTPVTSAASTGLRRQSSTDSRHSDALPRRVRRDVPAVSTPTFTQVLISTPAFGKQSGIHYGGLQLDEQNTNETLIQTIRRCLNKGFILNPFDLICKT